MMTTTWTTSDNEKVATTELMQNFATKFTNCSSFKVSTGGMRMATGLDFIQDQGFLCVCVGRPGNYSETEIWNSRPRRSGRFWLEIQICLHWNKRVDYNIYVLLWKVFITESSAISLFFGSLDYRSFVVFCLVYFELASDVIVAASF